MREYSLSRTPWGVSKTSVFNGVPINADDFLQMAEDFSGLVPTASTPEILKKYGVNREEFNDFAKVLSNFMHEPYEQGKECKGSI